MVELLQQLFTVIWREKFVPPQWREGLIVNLFKKGDKEDPGNYRGVTLLSVVGKVFCKVLYNRLVKHLDKGRALHEDQAGFRVIMSGRPRVNAYYYSPTHQLAVPRMRSSPRVCTLVLLILIVLVPGMFILRMC